jgi:hypothetical protein
MYQVSRSELALQKQRSGDLPDEQRLLGEILEARGGVPTA